MAEKKKPKLKSIYEEYDYSMLPGQAEAVMGMGGRARWAPITAFPDVRRLQPARTIYDMSDEPMVVEPRQETIYEMLAREMERLPTYRQGGRVKVARRNESGELVPRVSLRTAKR